MDTINDPYEFLEFLTHEITFRATDTKKISVGFLRQGIVVYTKDQESDKWIIAYFGLDTKLAIDTYNQLK